MTCRAICIALLLSSLPNAGCGTVANLVRPGPEAGGKAPFGGVRQDVACIENAANGDVGAGLLPTPDSEQYPRFVLMLCCVADLPLSLIGDLVTWPYTVSYTCINQPVPTPPVTIANPPVVPTLQPLPAPQPLPIRIPPVSQPKVERRPSTPPVELPPKPTKQP